jgi:hypothetical protein
VVRAHFECIVAHNVCPADDGRRGKQKDLAEKIRVGHKRLSEYKTGRGTHGILTARALALRRTDIVWGVMRVGLPAADDSAAASSADQARSACDVIRCDCDVIAI